MKRILIGFLLGYVCALPVGLVGAWSQEQQAKPIYSVGTDNTAYVFDDQDNK